MTTLRTRLMRGAVAGAAGTTALNAVTYGDMLLRGRSASGAPAKLSGVVADRLGLAPLRTDNHDPQAGHRRTALGALLGYATGVGIGAVYGIIHTNSGGAHALRTGVVLGLIAMATSDTPLALTGVSDPRTWSRTDWLSDLIPHHVYGLVTATVLDHSYGE